MIQGRYPVLYLIYYKRLKEKYGRQRLVKTKELHLVFSMAPMQIASKYHYSIFKDMEWLGLIEKVNKDWYKLTGGNKDELLYKYQNVLNY